MYSPRAIERTFPAALFLLTFPLLAHAQAKPAAAGTGNVASSGHLGRDMVKQNDEVRFWISVENKTTFPILNIHLDRLEHAGFEKKRWCWGTSFEKQACGIEVRPGPSCLAPGQKEFRTDDQFLLCPYLRPGESLAVWGDLIATDDLPPHELSAVLSWKLGQKPVIPCKQKDSTKCPAVEPPQEAESSQFVALGRAEPVAPWRYFFRRYTPRTEILIPGALTVLGFFFTWWTGRNEQRNQIWTTMLGKVHGFAMRYYMPAASICAGAVAGTDVFRTAARAARLAGAAGPAAIAAAVPAANLEAGRKGFTFLMMFHWWRRETFLKVGAYHLRTRSGEDLLRIFAGDHDRAFLGPTEAIRRSLDRIKNMLAKATTSDEILELLDGGHPDLNALWPLFVNWAASENCNRDLGVLEAFVSVTVYEVNRVSKDWYPGSVKIVPQQQRELDAFEEKARTSKDVRNYVTAAQRGWRIPIVERSY